jgi:nicotinate-nucleotide adenylyltransferase
MAHLKVACLGGSFNPIHYGHLALAKYLRSEKGFDEVWLILAKQAPLKDTISVPFDDRLAMISLAIEDQSHIKVCTLEKDMPTPSYTIDTVVLLQQRYTHDFSCIIGADQAKQFHHWKEADKLASLIPFYVVAREDFPLTTLSFTILPALSTTSSTLIRQGLSNDTSPKVLHYMIMHHLYDVSILEAHLKPKRIVHTLSVKETALSLIETLNINHDAMEVAAMFHDVAKEWDINEAAYWLTLEHIDVYTLADFEVHAYAGAAYLKHYYYIEDIEICDAIRHHTQGSSEHLMAKVLFIADKIEPTRNYDTSPLLKLAKEDIHTAFKQIKAENETYNTTLGGLQ